MTQLISIVIPTFNRVCDLKRALQSVQKQTYANWEALIVDNFSVDGTEEMVMEFNDPRMKLFKLHNKGVIAASRNLGISEANGEYVAFLDSDDWWAPEKLRISLFYLNQGAELVYHDLFLIKKPGQRFFPRKVRTRVLNKPVYEDLLISGNKINNSSVVVKKKLLTSIDGLSEDLDLVAAEDYDAWLRIAKITDKFHRINKTLGFYWAGGGNTTNPTQTLKIADVIESRYFDGDQIADVKLRYSWLDYARGRARFKLRCHELARKNLKKIHWNQAPPLIFFKAKWMLLAIYLFH